MGGAVETGVDGVVTAGRAVFLSIIARRLYLVVGYRAAGHSRPAFVAVCSVAVLSLENFRNVCQSLSS